MTKGKIWYVVLEGKADGPHTEEEIIDQLEKGRLGYSDLAFRPGFSRWISLGECKEFERRTAAPVQETAAPVKVSPPSSDFVGEGEKAWVILTKQKGDDGDSHYVQSGPFSTEQVRKKIENGAIKYDDHVWKKDFKSWKVVGSLEEFERRVVMLTPKDEEPAKPVAKSEPVKSGAPKQEAQTIELSKHESTKLAALKEEPKRPEPIKDLAPQKINVFESAPEKKLEAPIKKEKTDTQEKTVVFKSEEPEKASEKIQEKPGLSEKASTADLPSLKKESEQETIVAKGQEPPPAPRVSEKAPIPADSQELDEPIVREKRKKRGMIAVASAAFGMALTYAGISAYNENLEKIVSTERAKVVSNVKAPITKSKPVVEAPAVQAENPSEASPQSQPSQVAQNTQSPAKVAAATAPAASAPSSPAVNPELENPPTHKTPSVLKIVSLKTGTDHPQIILETDLPGGTQIDMKLSARAGSILKYPSFELEKKVTTHPGQLPTIDFTADHLPPGEYKLSLKGGDLEMNTPFAVGDHGPDFQRRLRSFKTQIAEQRRKEQEGLKSGTEFISRAYFNMTKNYHKVRASNSADLKRKWSLQIKAWRKDFDKQASALKHVDEKNRNFFVYPEELIKLKLLEEKLLDVALLYDKSLKTDRSIASESDMDQTFQEALEDMKSSLRKLRGK